MSSLSWNPWAELAHRAHLTLVWVDRGRRGCIDFRSREVTLRKSMTREERRCVLTHELVHDERGPVPRRLAPREEAAVRRESSRRLIGLAELGRALQWSPFVTEVAQELDVDVPTLQARLLALTDDERSALEDLVGTVPVDGDETVPA